MIGQRISHYRILDKLGEGGMGEVFLAQDSQLNRKVALKFLSRDTCDDQVAVRLFRREAEAAASIDHPFICKIYETGEEDGRAFIGMEFVEGDTLQDRIRAERLPWTEIVRIVIETAEGLAKAHESNVVHRDLKPANIMITSDGHVKVMDFGLAKRLFEVGHAETQSGLSSPGSVVGTPAYMSPEQLRGQLIDHRADIFALGLIFCELLSGAHPFRRESIFETASAIMYEEAPIPTRICAGCAPELDPILATMLQKDPNLRYHNARQLLADLRPVLTSPPPSSTPVARPSIAVLPFLNRSQDPENEYFSDGITEDLIAQLSKIGTLKVISRTSIMRYKGTEKGLAEISQELGVTTVVEGSVRRAGNRVRILTGLADCASGSQIWTETYDRELKDIFAVQTEVSRKIASALQKNLPADSPSVGTGKGPATIAAYPLYLKGRYYMHKLGADDLQKAIQHFNQALDLDPTYAKAYAGISESYATSGHFNYLSPEESFPKAREAARRSLELDSSLAEAHTSQGLVALFFDWDWAAAATSFAAALELNPNLAQAHTYLAWYLHVIGRLDEAVESARRAVELDPLSPYANMSFGWELSFSGRYSEAVEQLERTLEMEPGFLHARVVLATAYTGLKDFDKATELMAQGSWSTVHLGTQAALAGRHEDAREVLQEVTKAASSGEKFSAFDIALLCLCLGEKESGINWLQKAILLRDNKVIFLNEVLKLYRQTYPDLAPQLTDERLDDVVRLLGLEP